MVSYFRLKDESHGKRKHTHGMDGNEHSCRIPSIVWLPFITCIVLLFILDIFQIRTYTIKPQRLPSEEFQQEDPKSLKGFLIKNEGCRIPYMDPFDWSIRKFIEKPQAPNCSDGKPPLYDANRTAVFILPSSLEAYNIENSTSLSCCYKVFWRRPPKKATETDDKVQYSKRCVPLIESAEIKDEFIKVVCEYANETVYKDYFAFVPLKSNAKPLDLSDNRDDKLLNVLVIGLDAVSRVNLHRQMPKTVDYLQNISAIELLGYNKVGDNTFPNLVPVLTGLSENELRNTCWHNNEHFDKCPFLWKMYKKKGFVTAFGEDSAWMGTFNYVKRGFQQQPTDYMWGIFNRESERMIGNHHKMNVDQCIGSRQVYKTLLDYMKKFVDTMQEAEREYFAFFWGASLSHDYLNMPNLGDEDYKVFFEYLKETGKLENTALFFMSDHGIRWGDIRQTYQGRMEERLPFLYIVLPKEFRNKYTKMYRNLLRNVRRLTTPFDLHETLVDLSQIKQARLEESSTEKKRGYSLFKDIPPKRTCEDAGISSHWCACQQSYEVDKNSTIVHQAASAVVDNMNLQLEGYAQCSNLSLKAILDARLMSHGDHIVNGKANFKDYMLTVQTEPGDGIFESTVRHHIGKNITHFEIMGTISRLNLYGKQSLCVTDFHLKLYCYCKGFLEALAF